MGSEAQSASSTSEDVQAAEDQPAGTQSAAALTARELVGPQPTAADVATPAEPPARDPDPPSDQSDDRASTTESRSDPAADAPADAQDDPGETRPASNHTLTVPSWANHEFADVDWRQLEEPFLSARTTLMPRIGGSAGPRARGGSSPTRWSDSRIDRRGPGSGPAGERAPGYPSAIGHPSAIGDPSASRVRVPQFSATPPARPIGPEGATPARAATAVAAGAAVGGGTSSGSDALNVSRVLAGGMAAATSAIFGSYFGAFGTIGGAAIGSVATALVTQLYQRSIERTGSKVLASVKGGESSADTSASHSLMGTNRLAEVDTVRIGRPPRARLTGQMVRATLLVFVLGLGLVTGIEMAKGSSVLGHHRGTSMQRLFDPEPSVPPAPLRTSAGDGESVGRPDSAPDQTSAPSAGTAAPGSGQHDTGTLAPLGRSGSPNLPSVTTVPTPTVRPDRPDLPVLPGPAAHADHGEELLRGLPGESDHGGDRDRHSRSSHHVDSDQPTPGLSLGGGDDDR